MTSKPVALPADLASAYLALLAEREALQIERDAAVAEASNWQAEAANARAELSDTEARIAHLELRIEKLKRELYGPRSERTARLIEQLELELEDLHHGERGRACRAGRSSECPDGARFHAQAAGAQALA